MKKYYNLLILTIFTFVAFQFNSCEADRARFGCQCESTKVAEKEVIVNSTNPEGSYSTYDFSGELEADAACHAEMTLEFRWANIVPATGEKRPPISYEFQSLFGWFPTNEGMETHYYEDGVTVWRISISEAIDSSKPEGSSYGIVVSWAGTGNENQNEMQGVSCKIHIKYYKFEEEYNVANGDGC
ncbi:MAG: hypothetical protein V2I62_04975 [Bacteroidales bacterium]|jgi:hypothetical protein|nr:hypothetical protein [Bacteroidales bacterium]